MGGQKNVKKFLLIAGFSLVWGSCSKAHNPFPEAFIEVSQASNLHFVGERGAEQMNFNVSYEQADSALKTIEAMLIAHGWTAQTSDFMYPAIKTSNGSAYNGGPWIGQWTDSRGDVLIYLLKAGKAGEPSIGVQALFFPVEHVKTIQNNVKMSKAGGKKPA
jgi:hypothetical protein